MPRQAQKDPETIINDTRKEFTLNDCDKWFESSLLVVELIDSTLNLEGVKFGMTDHV